jgi:hypothetical protein
VPPIVSKAAIAIGRMRISRLRHLDARFKETSFPRTFAKWLKALKDSTDHGLTAEKLH